MEWITRVWRINQQILFSYVRLRSYFSITSKIPTDRFFSVVSVLGLIFHLPAKWGGGVIFNFQLNRMDYTSLAHQLKYSFLVTYLLGPFYSYQQNGMDYASLAHQLKDYFQLCTFCVLFFNFQLNGMNYASLAH